MKTTEEEFRKLRAAVYGECTDENWNAVKDNWSAPDGENWLREKAARPLSDFSKK